MVRPYFTNLSSSLDLSDLSKPFPVGLLACQRDPLLTTLETTISSVLIVTKPSNAKKGVSSKVPVLEIVLQDTILFPEGGGQPYDTGRIVLNGNEELIVQRVDRRGGYAVHTVHHSLKEGTVLPKVGAKVIVRLDEDRRWDLMSIHTAQHLVSALFETQGIPTLSWSLTVHPSPSYIQTNICPTADQIADVQCCADRLVRENTSVYVDVEALEEDALQTGKIPADYTGGVKRTVEIEGVERDLCCGTHLPTLSTLRVFILPRVESISGGQYRIYFLAGPRLIGYLAQVHEGLHNTASGLGCSVSQAPNRARQEVQQRTSANKRIEAVEEELGVLIAEKLLREADETDRPEGLFRKYLPRKDDSLSPLGVVNAIVRAFSRSVALEEKRRPHLVVITSSPSLPNSTATTVLVAFGSDEKMIKDLGGRLRQIGVKGGGTGSRFNGKAVGWKDSVDGQRLQQILEEIGTE